LTKFEHKAAIRDQLFGTLEVGVKVTLPSNDGTSVVVAGVEDV
jgi:hypothetical protein